MRGRRGRGKAAVDGGDDGEEGGSEEEDEGESCEAGAGAPSGTSYAPLVLHQSRRQRAHSTWNSFATPATTAAAGTLVAPQAQQLSAERAHTLHGTNSAAMSLHSTEPHPFATRPTFPPAFTAPRLHPRPSFPATKAAPLPHLDLHVSIEILSKGFLVSDLPPGHQFRVLSPEQCQVVAPTQDARASSFSQTLAQRAQLMPAAAFAFQVKADGAIEALKLPPGTRSSIGLVGKAGLGSERGELCVETSFVSADGFIVVLRSRMRG